MPAIDGSVQGHFAVADSDLNIRGVNIPIIGQAVADVLTNPLVRPDVALWPASKVAAPLNALKAGGPVEIIVADMKRLESRKAEVSRLLASADEPPPLLHPNMFEIYRQRVAALEQGLRNPEARLTAMEALRQLVDQVFRSGWCRRMASWRSCCVAIWRLCCALPRQAKARR